MQHSLFNTSSLKIHLTCLFVSLIIASIYWWHIYHYHVLAKQALSWSLTAQNTHAFNTYSKSSKAYSSKNALEADLKKSYGKIISYNLKFTRYGWQTSPKTATNFPIEMVYEVTYENGTLDQHLFYELDWFSSQLQPTIRAVFGSFKQKPQWNIEW